MHAHGEDRPDGCYQVHSEGQGGVEARAGPSSQAACQESRHDRLAALGEAAVLRSLDHVHINRLSASPRLGVSFGHPSQGLLEVVEDEFSVHLILEYAEGRQPSGVSD